MKKIFFFLIIPMLIPVLGLAGITHKACPNSYSMDISHDRLIEYLESLVKEEFKLRIPKSPPFYVYLCPRLGAYGTLTRNARCGISVQVPGIKKTQDALNTAFPFFQAYIDTMNNVPEVRPYLVTFPFSLPNWDFSLGFERNPQDYPSSSGSAPYIRYFSLSYSRMQLVQKTIGFGPRKEGAPWVISELPVYDAPEEAMPEAFLNLKIPRFAPSEKKEPRIIPQSKKNAAIFTLGKKTYDFFDSFGKKNNLIFIALRQIFPWIPGDKKNREEVAYATQERRLTLEEVKSLLYQMREEHAKFYLQDKWIKRDVNQAREKGLESLSNPIDAQKYMTFRISFWDKYIDRIKPPHIAEVQVFENKARYYVSDEYQRLQLVYEEDLPPYPVDIPLTNELEASLKKTEPKFHTS